MAGELREIEFRDPPEGFEDIKTQESRERFAKQLKDNPGKWGVIAVYKGGNEAAKQYASQLINKGANFWAPTDEGRFEGTVAPKETPDGETPEYELFARFVPTAATPSRGGRRR